MFYSHEILTDRKHGIATIWLVATLGAKSSARRVTKKAILQVNIPKACDTVTHPQVPMALRLSSNLLIGISRVHLSQCGYVLSDAEAIQQAMRTLMKALRDNFLDPNAGVVKPQTLLLEDDPAFLPGMIPDLDMDFGMLEMTSPYSSQPSSRRTPTDPSPVTSQGTPPGGFNIIIPSDDSPGSSARRPFVQEQEERLSFGLEDDGGLLVDAGFEFDEEGNLIETSQASNEEHEGHHGARTGRAAGGVAAVPQSEQAKGAELDQYPDQDNLEPASNEGQHQDQAAEQPEQEDVEMADQRDGEGQVPDQLDQHMQEEAAEAPVRKARTRKPLKLDERQDIRSTELQSWQTNYLANMNRAKKDRAARRLPQQAKSFAAACVFGNGLGGLGLAGPMMQKHSDLSIFAGQSLKDMVFGKEQQDEPRGTKRSHGDDSPSDDDERNVRRKSDEIEAARGADEDNVLNLEEEEVEVGRGAVDAMEDVTEQMPWNLPSSQNGGSRAGSRPGSRAGSNRARSRAGSTAVPGSTQRAQFVPFDADGNIPSSATADLQQLRQAGRLPSASPLQDRGLPSASTGYQGSPVNNFGSDDTAAGDFGDDEPGANDNTQTADEREWIESALRREEQNFLDFIGAGVERNEQTEITFEQLVPPTENNNIVATKGFLHLLSLASKGLLEIRQDDEFAAPIHIQLPVAP